MKIVFARVLLYHQSKTKEQEYFIIYRRAFLLLCVCVAFERLVSYSLTHAHKMFFVSLTTYKAQDTVTFDASLLWMCVVHIEENEERDRGREKSKRVAHMHKLHRSTTSG